jgi:single-strand DNA-binding protein
MADMSQDNQITLRGYVTAEPKFWQATPTRIPLAEIRVGSTPRRMNRETGEWLDGDTSYYTVKCWRRLAVNVASCLRKGDMVLIRGKVITRTWLDDQQRSRTQVQVEADSVGHDLSFGWSHFNRGIQPQQHAAQHLTDGETSRQDVSDYAEASGGGPGEDETGGEYEDYLAAGLAPGGGQDGQDGRDGQEAKDGRGESTAADGAIDELVRDLSEPAAVAPVF